MQQLKLFLPTIFILALFGASVTYSKVWTDSTLTGEGTEASPLGVNRAEEVIPPIIVAWDGQGGVVSTGQTIYRVAAYDFTITGWSIVATGSSPTTTIDIWKTGAGASLPTVANTIMGTKPALATGNAIQSTTLTGWTDLTVVAGEIIAFNIDASAAGLSIVFTLEVN